MSERIDYGKPGDPSGCYFPREWRSPGGAKVVNSLTGFALRPHMGAWLVEVFNERGHRFGIASEQFATKTAARRAAKAAGLVERKHASV